VRGLGLRYYSLPTSFKMYPQSQQMLQCVHKKNWSDGFHGKLYAQQNEENFKRTDELLKMVNLFTKVNTLTI
jgi:hypothetical protein